MLRSTRTRFLFNPFTIATCIGRPTSVFTNCAILYAIARAVSGKGLSSLFAIAFASYLSLYPLLLFPPIALTFYDREARRSKSSPNAYGFGISNVVFLFMAIGILLYMSYLITGGSWEFIASTYGVQLLLPDLTPNVGLWWYFFIEMFDSFREFFLGVFWLHLGGYVGGLSFRVRKQPLFVITSLIGIFAIFKPYPSISDTSLYFALLPLYRHIFPRKSFFLKSEPLPRLPCTWKWLTLPISSHAVYLPRGLDSAICHPARARLLLSVDLRRLRECELLLCHHTCMEFGPIVDTNRLVIRRA